MVVGHSTIPQWLSNWIWSFHMPFFFFISGLFTSWKKDLLKFNTDKTKSLLIPFVVYSIVNLLVYPLYSSDNWNEFATQVLLRGWNGYALWFIPVLYLSLIFCKIVPNQKYHNMIAIVCFMFLGGTLDHYNIEFPWTISTIPIACTYILIARLFRTPIVQILKSNNLTHHLLLMVAGGAVSLFISSHYRLDLAANSILPIIPLLFGAVAGTFMMLSVSKLLLSIPKFASVWVKVGSHTMEILALSQCAILIINQHTDINYLMKYFLLIFILYAIITVKDTVKHFIVIK